MMEAAETSSMAIVFLRTAIVPVPDEINSHIEETWPGYPLMRDVETDGVSETGFLLDGGMTGTISLVSRRYDREMLGDACERAWWWPGARQALDEEEFHLVITLSGSEDAHMRSFCLTYIASAYAALCDSVAVLWVPSTVLRPAQEFCMIAEEILDEDPPIPISLWVDFQICAGSDEARASLYSTGMEPLGFPEIEIQDSKISPDEMLSTARTVALYMLAVESVPEDGESIAFGDAEGIPVRHGESLAGAEQRVLILDLEAV